MPSKTIGLKLSDELRAQVIDECKSKNFSPSDYLRKLIVQELARSQNPNKFRLKITDDKLIVPCCHCGEPISYNLAELGLRRSS